MQPSYWMPAKVHPDAEDSAQKGDPERFEAPPNLAAAVDIRALTVRFGSFTALDKVSFKIYSTQVTALLGHNGAGKTTLMSTITGLLKPTSGVVEFPGSEGDANFNSTGFCQQFDVVFPDLTVREHLVYFGQLLILDEPTTGMDPETRRSIWDLLSELRNNTSILLSTHDMEEADVLADRIVMLSSGKLVCAGTPAFLKQACGAYLIL
ncbi:hypothetical protein HPB52_023646 [Rhipicephalus sanguineus]|uniref:ABC transporter domain-containing protein n=1 Tax=Rhipicephalus sanguineus TaxID=34632 RepID=A0A9D4Q3V6_RHISA|nr:hypothetical protein HPB52_023646 [Rhipicephalus sanguineus]